MSESVVFDRAADYYDQTRGFPPGEDKHVAALLARVGNWNKQSRVLEIAVGTGRIAAPLASLVAEMVGVDLSLAMMARVRTKPAGDSIRLAQADVTRLPFGDRSVDGAVAVHIFHLIPNWQDALSEVARVLKPGGVLVHGKSSRWDVSPEIWEDIYRAAPQYQTNVGADTRENDQFLIDEGWTRVGEMQEYGMTVEYTPRAFLDQMRQRMWSRSWKLSDEELAQAVDAAQQSILKHMGSLDQSVPTTIECRAGAYLPPGN